MKKVRFVIVIVYILMLSSIPNKEFWSSSPSILSSLVCFECVCVFHYMWCISVWECDYGKAHQGLNKCMNSITQSCIYKLTKLYNRFLHCKMINDKNSRGHGLSWPNHVKTVAFFSFISKCSALLKCLSPIIWWLRTRKSNVLANECILI